MYGKSNLFVIASTAFVLTPNAFMGKRGYKINVFLSDEEKQMLTDKVAETGFTYSIFLRFLI